MRKRRKAQISRQNPEPRVKNAAFESPFKDLRKLLRDRPQHEHQVQHEAKPTSASSTSAPTAVVPEASPRLDDEAMFRSAVEGVRRLGDQRATRIAPQLEISREVVSEDAEVLAQLSDLVAGQGRFELTETDEYVEGARLGIDPRLVTRLRRGEFAVQAHIDLHGMIQVDAKAALEQFVVNSVRKGLRAVLVVHGRGRRSPGGMPVLKHAAAQWLSHGITGGYVLAFATARPADGGAGAMYVLLRRERRRAPFNILHGAHRGD